MLKPKFIALLCAALMLTLGAPVAAQGDPNPIPDSPVPPEQRILTAFVPRVNVRSGPSTDFTRIGTINEGEWFNVVGIQGTWYIIEFQGREGFVSGEFVYVNNGFPNGVGELALIPVDPEDAFYVLDSNMNLRRLPTVTSDVILIVPFGTTVSVLGRSDNNNWAYISHYGVEGWMSACCGESLGNFDAVPVLGTEIDQQSTTMTVTEEPEPETIEDVIREALGDTADELEDPPQLNTIEPAESGE